MGRSVPVQWVWVVFLGLATLPLPFLSLGPMPERGAPIAYLMLAAALVLFARVTETSWPLGLLLTYLLVVHVLWPGMPHRAAQLLLLLTLAALLYREAVHLPERLVTIACWALLGGAAIQAALGAANLWGYYPSPTWLAGPWHSAFGRGDARWMLLVSPDYSGRTMGWLTHPNYWGSFLALLAPVAYRFAGRTAGLVTLALVSLSGSLGPCVTALAALTVVGWRDLPRLGRLLLLAGGSAGLLVVAVQHIVPRTVTAGLTIEAILSGRFQVWRAAWPRLLEAPIVGHGLGSWRLWADQYNQITQSGFATQQAHNEALQLQFELGLIGVAIVAVWLWQIGRAALREWHRTELLHDIFGDLYHVPELRMWVAVLVAGLVNSVGSPTFHLPAQAGIVLFATARIHALTTRPLTQG